MDSAEHAELATSALSRENEVATRLRAIDALRGRILEDEGLFTHMLQRVQDPTEDRSVRHAIFSAIQGEMFSKPEAIAQRPHWLAALRGLVAGPEPELRVNALRLLSHHKDAFTQELLLNGLRKPAKAFVPPEQALQFLANDVHADAYSVAHAIVAAPPNEAARIAALELLAADAASTPLFESILHNRQENPAARDVAMVALASLAPVAAREHAIAIISTPDEAPSVVVSALAMLASADVHIPTPVFQRIIELLSSTNADVRQAAERIYEAAWMC